jgi:hypothetical protein
LGHNFLRFIDPVARAHDRSALLKKLLLWIDVDPVEREVFNFVSLYLTVADVVLIFGTAGIGVYKLLESEVEG